MDRANIHTKNIFNFSSATRTVRRPLTHQVLKPTANDDLVLGGAIPRPVRRPTPIPSHPPIAPPVGGNKVLDGDPFPV